MSLHLVTLGKEKAYHPHCGSEKMETESQIRNDRQGGKWRSQGEKKTNKNKNLSTANATLAKLVREAETGRHTLPGCKRRKAPLFCLEVSRGEASPAAPLTLGSTDYFEGSG